MHDAHTVADGKYVIPDELVSDAGFLLVTHIRHTYNSQSKQSKRSTQIQL